MTFVKNGEPFIFFFLISAILRDYICKKNGAPLLVSYFQSLYVATFVKKRGPITCCLFAILYVTIFVKKKLGTPITCCLIAVFVRDNICKQKWGPFTCFLISIFVRDNICEEKVVPPLLAAYSLDIFLT